MGSRRGGVCIGFLARFGPTGLARSAEREGRRGDLLVGGFAFCVPLLQRTGGSSAEAAAGRESEKREGGWLPGAGEALRPWQGSFTRGGWRGEEEEEGAKRGGNGASAGSPFGTIGGIG